MKTFFQLREELEDLSEAKLPGAFKLGDHAGHTFYGTKKQNHPDGSATLKLKLRSSHATDKDGAHKYATKAADKLKAKGYNVHKVSVRKSESGFGEAEHTASIHLSHNVKESTIHEAAIHSKGGTTVHHSDEDRAENYTIKHGGKTHSVSTGPHLFKKSADLEQNDIAGHVNHHISQQAPNIPSHAKAAIVKHMESMY
jgi:hypothetical protein